MNVSISQLICIIILFVCLIFVSFKCVATLEKENERLQQLIEKMKNCQNCKHSYHDRYHNLQCIRNCVNFDKWELAE